MQDQTVVVIGGTSGIGLRVAELVTALGAKVVVGGRSQERISAALDRLGDLATGKVVDIGDRNAVEAFFADIPALDHLFTPGASYAMGRIDEISDAVAESPFQSKFWGQYQAAKHALPRLSHNGSIVLMSGAASVRPLPGSAAYAACNSAIEGLARGLAVELAPIRVNCVSPGTTDSDLWRRRPEALRRQAFGSYENSTLLGRVGTVDEVAEAVLFLMRNSFMTGSTLFPDGGYALR